MKLVSFETAVTEAKKRIDLGTGNKEVGLIVTLFFSNQISRNLDVDEQRAEVVMATHNASKIMGCDLPKERYRHRIKKIFDEAGHEISAQDALKTRKKRETLDEDSPEKGYRGSYEIETDAEGVIRVHDYVIKTVFCSERLYICWSIVTRNPKLITEEYIKSVLE